MLKQLWYSIDKGDNYAEKQLCHTLLYFAINGYYFHVAQLIICCFYRA